MTLVYTHKTARSEYGIGGKARNLLALQKLKITVPDWVVIPEDVLLAQIPTQDRSEAQINFDNLVVPEEVLTQIAEHFGSNHLGKTYAVRSSAVDEDGTRFSFAGQFETYLNITFHDLSEKIKGVWRSAATDRVRKYRKENNLSVHLGIAVIVQEMIDAEVSGVGFGIDPVSGDVDKNVISAVYGLGEGLVSGELDADIYTVSPAGIDRHIAQKAHRFTFHPNGKGIAKIEVNPEKRSQPALSDTQIQEIGEILNRLHTSLGKAQDIEFAWSENRLYLLQTRPVTATGNETKGEYILWDNSNIVESYPGITTPLTFSFILVMYEKVYRQFVALMGVSEREVEKNAHVFANTLGLVRGRVYYNLLNWYKMLAMLPGYSINAGFMENMMGVKEQFDLKEDYRTGKGLAWFRIFKMLIRMIFIHAELPRKREKFQKHLSITLNDYKKMDFTLLSPREIITCYKSFEKKLLLEWKAPLINDFFAMVWFGILQKLTMKYFPDDPNLHNNLLCGSQDIISVEPIHNSIRIAHIVQQDEQSLHLFKNTPPEQVWNTLKGGMFPEIKTKIDEYIARFGERCVGELKLETISYSQEPYLFIKVIQSYVRQGITEKKLQSGLENKLRALAESRLSQVMKGRPIRHKIFNYILSKTRELVSNRENLRYERTRAFGIVRTMFNALGSQWHKAGLIPDPRDVFYLELKELKALKDDTLDETLRAKIKERKSEFECYRRQPPPKDRFFTYGTDFHDRYIYSEEKLDKIESDLTGIGCCPGRIQAQVRVVTHPDETDSLNGDILVTSSTDPGWVTLFPTASGIIVERGSLLSHSAIVSREMGIPCIVSVSGLLRTLKSGDEVLMDGSTGKITITG